MIGRNEAGEFTFTVDERTEVIDGLKEVFMTPVGLEYKRSFYVPENGDADLEKILKAAQLVAGGPNITVGAMLRGLELVLDAGEIQPNDFAAAEPELVEPEEDTRPRDKNGKLLTAVQIAYAEHVEYANSHSAEECRRRARSDAEFGKFMRKQLSAEMSQPIGDAVTPAGEPEKKSRETLELRKFVTDFQNTPSDLLKPRGGYVTIGGQQMRWSDYRATLEKAAQAGLL